MATDSRRRIVEAAVRVLSSQGYAATSVKDIAAEAGVAPGLVHYYFATKEDLIVAAVEYACAELRPRVEGDPIEFARAGLEQAKRPEQPFWRLFTEMLALAPRNQAVRETLLRSIALDRGYMEQAIRAVMAQWEGWGQDEAPAVAAVAWAAMFGIWVQGELDPGFDRAAAIDAFAKLTMGERR